MKIEIYACRFGAGHMKAAEFLQSQLSEYETEIFDIPFYLLYVQYGILYDTYHIPIPADVKISRISA